VLTFCCLNQTEKISSYNSWQLGSHRIQANILRRFSRHHLCLW